VNKKNTGVQEFRSSGVQEFRSSGVQENPGQTGDRSDLTGLFLGYNPPLEKNFSGSRIEVGLESPSHGHSELLNSSLLNSFQMLYIRQHCYNHENLFFQRPSQ
jgi:hypothetical protein